jgi:hypothetical protein
MTLVTRHTAGGDNLLASGETTLCPMGAAGYHVHSSYRGPTEAGYLRTIGLHAQTYATAEAALAAYAEQCGRLDRIVANRDVA